MTSLLGLAQAERGTRHDEDVDGIKLLTQTRPQWTRNALEAQLLIQVAFSRRISDAITQPILDISGRDAEPSLLFQLFLDHPGRPTFHVVDVDAGDGALDATTIQLTRAWCAERGFGYVVADDAVLWTPYLDNARLLTRYVGLWPLEDDIGTIGETIIRDNGRTTVGDAIAALVANGVDEIDAKDVVRQAIANWFFDCDLRRRFDRSSPLYRLDPDAYRDSRKDPFLSMLLASAV